MSKPVKIPFLFLLTVFLFASCDKEVTGITYVTHLKATTDEITVNDTQNNNSNLFDIEFDVNLENEDTREYLDQIKNFELEKISLFFHGLDSLAENQTPTHLKITIDNDIVFDYSDFKYSMIANGNPFVINDTEKLNEVAELLYNNKFIHVKIEGEIPDTQYYQFFIEIDVLAKMEVDAL